MSEWTLRRSAFTPRPGPILVVVMDGVGLGNGDEGDAVALARTPSLDRLRQWDFARMLDNAEKTAATEASTQR